MTARAAHLTPSGTGAVATIAIVGDSAWSIIQSSFSVRSKTVCPTPPQQGAVLFGNFGEPPGDEVVVTVRPDATDWFEIHCHGGPQVVDWLLEQMAQHGATIVPWIELERQVSTKHFQAQAARQLTQAMTLRTASILLDQYHGALAKGLQSIIQTFDEHQPDAARLKLERLATLCNIGRHLIHPWRVAVCGPPNAGKSSLVNALAGYQRTVVTPIAGTTRDTVSTLLAFDGWPIELLDTAGIRQSTDQLEEKGIQLGLNAARDADLVLWVTEPNGWKPPPAEIDTALCVLNKSDLLNASNYGQPPNAVLVSATTGSGLELLIAAIVIRIIPNPPTRDEAVPFVPEQIDAIFTARQLWNAGDLFGARQILANLLSPADLA